MNVEQRKHRDLPRTEEKCHYNVKVAGKIEIQFPYTKNQDAGLETSKVQTAMQDRKASRGSIERPVRPQHSTLSLVFIGFYS